MALASTSVLVLQRAPPHGCHQYPCPRVSSSHLLPPQEAICDEQVGLTETLSNYCFCTGSWSR